MARYILRNYGLNGGHEAETCAFSTLKEVKENARGEFSLCQDLLTGESFEPCEIQ